MITPRDSTAFAISSNEILATAHGIFAWGLKNARFLIYSKNRNRLCEGTRLMRVSIEDDLALIETDCYFNYHFKFKKSPYKTFLKIPYFVFFGYPRGRDQVGGILTPVRKPYHPYAGKSLFTFRERTESSYKATFGASGAPIFHPKTLEVYSILTLKKEKGSIRYGADSKTIDFFLNIKKEWQEVGICYEREHNHVRGIGLCIARVMIQSVPWLGQLEIRKFYEEIISYDE